MPHSLTCVLRIPIIAITILLLLWLAISYSVTQASSVAAHTLPATLVTDTSRLSAEKLALQATDAGHTPISVTLQPAPSAMLDTYFHRPTRSRQQLGPAVLVTKTVGLEPGCAPTNLLVIGEPTVVVYCYVFFNVGSTTMLTHTILDDKIGPILVNHFYPRAPNGGEGSGAFFTLTTTIESTTKNVVSWSAIDENQSEVTAIAEASVVIPTIELTTTLSGDPSQCGQDRILSALPDTTISVCYTIKNSSPITLTNHTLEDSSVGLLLRDDARPLGPGDTRSIKRTMAVTQSITGIISWTATPENATENTIMAKAVDQFVVQVPAIELQATVGQGATDCPVTKSITVTIDTMVTLCYLVTNIGGHPLDHHLISDTIYTYPVLTDVLLPGKSLGVTVTFRATDTLYGVGEWRASGPDGLLAIARDTFSVAIRSDAIVEVYVFYDVDGKGEFDEMEPGIPGVEIELISPRGRRYTVTTDSTGLARLDGLPETGNYTPTINLDTLPPGYYETTNKRGISVERGQVVTQQIGIGAPEGTDTDQDMITDKEERSNDYDHDGIPNYLDLDSDDDGLPDKFEGTNDSNRDGRPNRLDPTRFLFLPVISK